MNQYLKQLLVKAIRARAVGDLKTEQASLSEFVTRKSALILELATPEDLPPVEDDNLDGEAGELGDEGLGDGLDDLPEDDDDLDNLEPDELSDDLDDIDDDVEPLSDEEIEQLRDIIAKLGDGELDPDHDGDVDLTLRDLDDGKTELGDVNGEDDLSDDSLVKEAVQNVKKAKNLKKLTLEQAIDARLVLALLG